MKTYPMPAYLVIISVICLLLISSGFIIRKVNHFVSPPRSAVKHVEWSKNAVIYEVNIRQYSNEGTFKAFERDLPRIKELGVKIIWIMPVYPIGEKNRKGKLGSYYAIRDYKAINPEFGNMDDFKHLVQSIHNLDMKVILDWVANHTAWDHPLVKSHPEYYMKDSAGRFVSPFDWTDVVRFDYKNPATRKFMTETMEWWLKESDIDGFRCDVASLVPTSFWDELRPELEKIKPVFMLAEADIPEEQLQAFDMSYDWKFHHLMNDIAKGKKNANAIMKHFSMVDSLYPGNAYLMQFTSNHDENSWNGTEYERLGEGAKTFAVLAATVPGMPLIYNAQESAFNRRLIFFDKDNIDWHNYSLTSFYQTLIDLKKRNKALWNGDEGGSMKRIATNRDTSVFVFVRTKNNQKVLVICNLTAKVLEVKLSSGLLTGNYLEIFTNGKKSFGSIEKISLKPWEFLVYEVE